MNAKGGETQLLTTSQTVEPSPYYLRFISRLEGTMDLSLCPKPKIEPPQIRSLKSGDKKSGD